MNRAGGCILCGSVTLARFPTRLAPFVRARMEVTEEESTTDLCFCGACTVAFFDSRPSDEQMKKLYDGYRGPAYAALREKHEPGYARINESVGAADSEMRSRRDHLNRLLRRSFRHERPTRDLKVLDWGGDRGQFIPDFFADSVRMVYEISGTTPIEGVLPVERPIPGSYDFVMCCHTLEHVSDPSSMLSEIAFSLREEGWVYLEVPFDLPERAMLKLLLPDAPWNFQPIPMHEHINFFTSRSLALALERAGMMPVRIGNHRLEFGSERMNVLSALAVKRPVANGRSEHAILRGLDILAAARSLATHRINRLKNFGENAARKS